MSLQPHSGESGLWRDTTLSRGDRSRGVHAVIIGVSDYPHLASGSDPAPSSAGMGQLAVSARTAAMLFRWLTYSGAFGGAPLASCRLLLSPTPGEAQDVALSTGGHFREATFANISAAVKAWGDDIVAAADPPDVNVALFFFSGHGLERAGEQYLLAKDILNPNSASGRTNALDVDHIWKALRGYGIEQGFLFLDACRNDTGAARDLGIEGQRVLTALMTPRTPPKAIPCLKATGTGEFAYQIAGPQGTFFGQALLDSLSGLPPDYIPYNCGMVPWRLNFSNLESWVQARVRDRLANHAVNSEQPVEAYGYPYNGNALVALRDPPQQQQQQQRQQHDEPRQEQQQQQRQQYDEPRRPRQEQQQQQRQQYDEPRQPRQEQQQQQQRQQYDEPRQPPQQQQQQQGQQNDEPRWQQQQQQPPQPQNPWSPELDPVGMIPLRAERAFARFSASLTHNLRVAGALADPRAMRDVLRHEGITGPWIDTLKIREVTSGQPLDAASLRVSQAHQTESGGVVTAWMDVHLPKGLGHAVWIQVGYPGERVCAVALPRDLKGDVPVRLDVTYAQPNPGPGAHWVLQALTARVGEPEGAERDAWQPLWTAQRADQVASLDAARSVLGNAGDLEVRLTEKTESPLAAAAATLYLLRSGDLESLRDWPRNLAMWFPLLPDGAFLWAETQRLRHDYAGTKPGKKEQEEMVRHFVVGCNQGTPRLGRVLDMAARQATAFERYAKALGGDWPMRFAKSAALIRETSQLAAQGGLYAAFSSTDELPTTLARGLASVSRVQE